MIAYAARRLLMTIPVLFAIVTLVFAIRSFVPGDPVEIMFFGQTANPEVIENIRRQMGSISRSRSNTSSTWATCCAAIWGRASDPQPVTGIANRYPATFQLAVGSFLVAAVVGLVSGILAAVYKDSPIDTLAMIVATTGSPCRLSGSAVGDLPLFGQLGWFSVIPMGR